MELLKLIKNRITTEWKETFNKNVDILNRNARDQDQKLETTNSRIDNLVLHSGGESPNEIVDARVNNEGTIFDSLEARLLAAENKHASDVIRLDVQDQSQTSQLNQLNATIEELYNFSNAGISIYVSAERGNDQTGNGTQSNPFKTIQMAVNQIPLISRTGISIWIEEGVYLEDVVLTNLSVSALYFRAVQTIADPSASDLAVKLRSFKIAYSSGYFFMSGIQYVDQANAPLVSDQRRSVQVEQGGYLAVSGCKFAENVKSMEHVSIYAGGSSKLHVYGKTTFINQNVCMSATLLAELRAGDIQGSSNLVGALADSGTVRASISSSFATTPTKTASYGLIITKGTVM